MTKRTCSVPGCEQPHQAKGFCKNCYAMTRRLQNPYQPVAHDRNCLHCGRDFISRNRQRKYCYEEGCEKAAKRGRVSNKGKFCTECNQPGVVARGFCITHYTAWHRATKGRAASTAPRTVYSKLCAFCDKPFATQDNRSTCCSVRCATYLRVGRSKCHDIEVSTTVRQKPKIKTFVAKGVWTSGKCRVCAAWFISNYTHVTCSDECGQTYKRESRREHKHKRRALKKSAFVAPVSRKKIFEADGYKCHICGKLTNPSLSVPHHRAPTLDHVIPLARGGTHEPANCRTACFICNARKGDRGGNEQLALTW